MGIRTYALSGFALLSIIISPVQAYAGTEVPETINVIPLANAKVRPLVPATLGLLVNTNDPDSIKIAAAYIKKRGIPESNVLRVALPVKDKISKAEFNTITSALTSARTSKNLVGWAIAWNKPWAVENQSITSAITEGVSGLKWSGTCIPTSPNAVSLLPAGAALPTPISMMLAGGTIDASLALVGRAGIGDAQNATGVSYLMDTTDSIRTGARKPQFADAVKVGAAKGNSVLIVKGNAITNKSDVMSYQTGLVSVGGLDTLKFRGGAYADHLTSYGGVLNGTSQMPITKFIQAGATGSFGTVREPCAYPAKFPHVRHQLDRYLSGDSLIEAYWKSIGMATEGLFIGEPLARPFSLLTVTRSGAAYTLRANRLTPSGTFNVAEVSSGQPRIILTNLKLAPSSANNVVANIGMSLPAGTKPIFALIPVEITSPTTPPVIVKPPIIIQPPVAPVQPPVQPPIVVKPPVIVQPVQPPVVVKPPVVVQPPVVVKPPVVVNPPIQTPVVDQSTLVRQLLEKMVQDMRAKSIVIPPELEKWLNGIKGQMAVTSPTVPKG